MELKAVLMDENTVRRCVMRISHEITEKNKGTEDIVLFGIRRRGMPIAKMIQQNLKVIEGVEVPCDELDIRFYRDDLTIEHIDPKVSETTHLFNVTDKKVVIVDDVLYTGRTVRAAIEAIFNLGRPKSIQLAILIDRGHREIPIRADYVGKNIPTSKTELIKVCVPEYDGECKVELYTINI